MAVHSIPAVDRQRGADTLIQGGLFVAQAAGLAVKLPFALLKFRLTLPGRLQLAQTLDLVGVLGLSILRFDAAQLVADLLKLLGDRDPAPDGLGQLFICQCLSHVALLRDSNACSFHFLQAGGQDIPRAPE
jgi:hypothetical protein